MMLGGRAVRVGSVLAAALAVALLSLVTGPGDASARPAVAATETVSLPNGIAQGVAVDVSTDTAYVTALGSSRSGKVYAVDLATGTVIATIAVGWEPAAIGVNPTTDTVYAVNWRDATVSIISGATDKVTATIPLPHPAGDVGGNIVVNAATNKVYISGGFNGIEMLDGATNSVTFIPLSSCAAMLTDGITLDPATDTVYTNCWDGTGDHLIGINGATGTVAKDVKQKWISNGPLTFDPKTNLLYVGRVSTGTGEGVAAFDGTTLAPAGSVNLPGQPGSLQSDPGTGTVYAALNSAVDGHDYIDLVNSASTAMTGAIKVPGPGWVAVEPGAGTLVYVAIGDPDSTLEVIHLAAPAITSRNTVTFTTGIGNRFIVTGTGTPAPTFTEKGKLPYDLSLFADGILCCMTVRGTGGVYRITITASNGVSPAATQLFTLIVDEPPAITSSNHATFAHGRRGVFTVRTAAFPIAAVTERGVLPHGLRFTAGLNGTAVISGIPAKAARGKTYVIVLTARNGDGKPATQRFSLRVS